MRPEAIDFLLRVCDAANIPGSHAEIMAEAKQSLRQMLDSDKAQPTPVVYPVLSAAEAKVAARRSAEQNANILGD